MTEGKRRLRQMIAAPLTAGTYQVLQRTLRLRNQEIRLAPMLPRVTVPGAGIVVVWVSGTRM
jgi:hypothetical protein